MDKRSEKTGLPVEYKIRLSIGCIGCFYMVAAAVLDANDYYWAALMLVAYIVTAPIIYIGYKCSTLNKTSNYTIRSTHAKLAHILYFILAAEWTFNCIDYYLGSEQIWKFSLCLCMLLNGIYAQFMAVLAKNITSIIISSFSWIMSIAGMTLVGFSTVQLLWLSALGFVFSHVLPTTIEIIKVRNSKADTADR